MVVVEQRQGIGGQLVQQRILEAQRGLDLKARLLLAKDVRDVVGTKRASGMSFAERSSNGVWPIFSNERKQLADLSGKATVGVGQTA